MDQHMIVKTTLGAVKGQKVNSIRSGSYYSFKGIPYAKPPVGDLRFKNPEPAEPWTGVRDAFEHGPVCPALEFLNRSNIVGEEDCLYLNVYSPNVDPAQKLPVLVWIHGGAFISGSGNSNLYGPDYIIANDVILVTFNYRLNVLGFLSLENKACPGNFGLKDMVMALKWVQNNICSFGGDSNNVTIFGESAGAAAVSYLMISPSTKGLFHKAISQSGCCLSPWVRSRHPKRFAYALGEKLGFKTTNDTELLQFLKTVEPRKLAVESDSIQRDHDPFEYYLSMAFVPVVEPEGTPGAFLTKSPHEIVQAGLMHDLPYINGVNTLEGLIMVALRSEEELDHENFVRLIPADMEIPHNSEHAKELSEKIKNHYFKNGYDYLSEIKALTSIQFKNGLAYMVDQAVHSKRKSPMYNYVFTYEGKEGLIKKFANCTIPGTVHGDELSYLFASNFPIVDTSLTRDTTSYHVMETITKLWTNFAKTGNPTSELEGKVQIKWEPVTKDSNCYLDIGEELKMKSDLEKEDVSFWHEMYQSVGVFK